MSSTYESVNSLNGAKITWVARIKDFPDHFKPNGARTHSNTPKSVTKAVNHVFSGLIAICQYEERTSAVL